MALIQCSSCNKQISDKASVCPQCGQRVVVVPVEEKTVFTLCSECGTELTQGTESCPNCGCPVTQIPLESADPVAPISTDTSIKAKLTQNRIIFIAVAIAAVVIAAVIGSRIYQHKQAQTAAIALEKYENAYQNTAFLMYLGALDAEEAGNLIKQVWYNAIFEERDDTTDQYTRPDGYFVDFNDALANLFADEEFLDDINTMIHRQKTVTTSMKNMKEVPEGYEDAYEALMDFYEAYTTMTNMVINPNGSLQTFSEEFNAADSEAATCYDTVKLYLDD